MKKIMLILILSLISTPALAGDDLWGNNYTELNVGIRPFVGVGVISNFENEEQNIRGTFDLGINVFAFGDYNRIEVLSPMLSFTSAGNLAPGVEVLGFSYNNGIGGGIRILHDGVENGWTPGIGLRFSFE